MGERKVREKRLKICSQIIFMNRIENKMKFTTTYRQVDDFTCGMVATHDRHHHFRHTQLALIQVVIRQVVIQVVSEEKQVTIKILLYLILETKC
jgi:hypothetical protein